mmetsp:Transcript_15168/g.39975  ORF Transcript_15168/g.39975 Transcript_15168/m.39975 type:complete len:235 (-) Transcript_15168:7-711(-)
MNEARQQRETNLTQRNASSAGPEALERASTQNSLARPSFFPAQPRSFGQASASLPPAVVQCSEAQQSGHCASVACPSVQLVPEARSPRLGLVHVKELIALADVFRRGDDKRIVRKVARHMRVGRLLGASVVVSRGAGACCPCGVRNLVGPGEHVGILVAVAISQHPHDAVFHDVAFHDVARGKGTGAAVGIGQHSDLAAVYQRRAPCRGGQPRRDQRPSTRDVPQHELTACLGE